MRCNWLGVFAVLAFGCFGWGASCHAQDGASAAIVSEQPKSEFEATHTEVHPLVPKRNGSAGKLHTFKLTPDGHIVAGVTFDQNYLQVYSPNLELLLEIPIDFQATAISIEPSGTFLVGGGGQIARLSTSGEVLKTSPAPHLAGQTAEEVKEKMIAECKKQMEQTREIYAQQIERIQKQIDKLTKKQEEKGDDFSKRDQSRLDSLKEQLTRYQAYVEEQFSGEINDDTLKYMLERQTRIPSLAAAGDDVFVAVSMGRGYEIWRVDSNFENPTKVIEDLSGCCGQFDFYAANGNLYLAENTKFQVGIYDRDGKHLNGFGERAGSSEAGFGSCCNPMNVVCTSTGEILTAESSIGKIKRFNQAGELVGVVGKARIGRGCKHVALGFDESRNRYYVQYEDNNSICVLMPNAEAEVVQAETNKNRQAAVAEVVKLAGRWERIKLEEEAATGEQPGATLGDRPTTDVYMAVRTDFQFLTFDAAGENLQCEFAKATEEHAGIIARLPGGDEFGNRAPVSYVTVPQSLTDGLVRIDLEEESGTIEFELRAKLEGDTLTVTFVEPYSPNLKSMAFRRAADPTSTQVGE